MKRCIKWDAGAACVLLVTVLLSLGGSSADAQTWDVFGGGGILMTDSPYPLGNLGASGWVTQHLAVGGRIEWTDNYAVSLLSIHGRIKMSGEWDLLVGSSPVGYTSWGEAFRGPIVDVLAGRRVSARFRVRAGASMLFSDGGHVYLLGQGVWSFD